MSTLAGAHQPPPAATGAAPIHPHGRTQALWLVRRSVRGTLRRPVALAPAFIFPLFFAALSSSSFSRATELPGFPAVDSFLQFMLAATIVQGVTFGSIQAGSDMAIDIEQGFFDRLMASPSSRTAVVVGHLGGAFLIGTLQALVFCLVLIPFGATVEGGVVGVALLSLGGGLVATAFGGVMVAMGIKTGSSEAVQGFFPLLFVLLFFSSAFFPRETMDGWFRWVADHNPMSFLVEGLRGIVIEGVSVRRVLEALGIPLLATALGVTLSLLALRGRLAAR
jgi:ABC-2 type transport system permease protein